MPTDRLDVEDEERRQDRLRHLLQRINESTNNNNNDTAFSNDAPFIQPGPSTYDLGVQQTHAVEPPRELLERVEAFLPQMEAANAELRGRMESTTVDIETMGESEDEYIEMNLGLGVFDLRPRQTSDSTSTDSSDQSHSDSSSESDVSSSESSSDDDASSVMPAASQRPIRPLPARAHPKIIVLGESTNQSPLPTTPNNDTLE